MLEILISLMALVPLAKHPKRRRSMSRYLRGQVDESIQLSTLGAKVLLSADFDESVTEETLVTSIVATYSMIDFTKGTGDGPILVGIAHSDYTDAEIEAVIESTGSWNRGDKVAQEVAKRQVRRIGIFDVPNTAEETSVLNDGKPIKTKLNWVLQTGQTLTLWGYNMGSSALATTSPNINVEGHINLFTL